jgi:hypothetical protein
MDGQRTEKEGVGKEASLRTVAPGTFDSLVEILL